MPRRTLGAVAACLAPLAALGPLGPVPAAALAEAGPTLVIEGKGFGHGVGMPQDGAYSLAAQGASAPTILNRFYPGTSLARRGGITVRVAVHESAGPLVVVLPGGGEIRDAPGGAQSPGFPVTVNPGGSVQLSTDGGKYRALPLSGAAITRAASPAAPAPAGPAPTAPPTTGAPATTVTTNLLDPLLGQLLPTIVPPATAPPTATTAPAPTVPPGQKDAVSSRGLWAVPKGDTPVALPEPGRSYRGTIQATGAGRGLSVVNEVDVEQYLRGLGEMPASWPAAALQAQAIAARTFAARAAAAGRVLCDDQMCQVYIGTGNEHPATTAATNATRGQVLTYQGALAETVYSASAGGMSATPEEGFGPGSPDLPYLKPVPYPVGDPQLWATTLPLSQAAARFGYRGELQQVVVARTGPSGRPLEIRFDGSGGPMVVDAHRFWAELRLRSTMFTLRTEASQAAADAGAALYTGGSPAVAESKGSRRGIVASSPVEPLGRSPWVALAALLMAGWATAAHRAGGRRAPSVGAPAPTGPASAAEAEPPS